MAPLAEVGCQPSKAEQEDATDMPKMTSAQVRRPFLRLFAFRGGGETSTLALVALLSLAGAFEAQDHTDTIVPTVFLE